MGLKNIVIFASGNGSNFEAIIQSIESNQLSANCVGCVVDKENAFVIERAKNHNIPVYLCLRKDFNSKVEMEESMLKQLELWKCDFIEIGRAHV